jgi:fermentation-respiration switch protein FrsA (DUF1100 family)
MLAAGAALASASPAGAAPRVDAAASVDVGAGSNVGNGTGIAKRRDHVSVGTRGAALTSVRAWDPTSELLIIGHSVGGQLALLNGRAGDAIVALAPVTDLVAGYREGSGDGAVEEFLQASPESRPDLFAEASPIAHIPPPGDVLVVHGRDDARVPVTQSRAYVAASRAAGRDIAFLELPSLPHLDAIDPSAPHWRDVFAWLERGRAASV